jgi:hypothetical protein
MHGSRGLFPHIAHKSLSPPIRMIRGPREFRFCPMLHFVPRLLRKKCEPAQGPDAWVDRYPRHTIVVAPKRGCAVAGSTGLVPGSRCKRPDGAIPGRARPMKCHRFPPK